MSSNPGPDPGISVDPQRVIDRLTQLLVEAQVRAAQFAALADQLLAERRVTHTGDTKE